LVLGFFAIAVIGILAAIAIPAYNDYKVRAQISEALATVSTVKIKVEEFYVANERCPANGDGGIGSERSYESKMISWINLDEAEDDDSCLIEIHFKPFSGYQGDDGVVQFWLDKQQQWHHASNLPPRYLPMSLR
jgi:type IV pilus assembly protein PilA